MSDLEAAARLAVDAALAEGGGEADAWCQDSVERSVRVYEGKVESITEAGSKGAGVRVFREGRTGYAYGSDLSEPGLRELARAAAASATVTEPDENAGIPREPGAAQVNGLRSPSFGEWTMERRVELALQVERAARERDPLITNVEDTVYSDAEARAALANSNGFCASYEETQCYAFAYAFAGDGADRMTGMGFGVGRGPDDLEPEAVGHEAADRALALHGARQPESRRCPVVLDPFVAASFASIIGRTLSADAVQRGRSLFAGREGDQIAATGFRLADDGLHPEGLATSPFDGEGVARQTTALIDEGVLRTYLFDTYTANKAQRASTGNGDRGSYRTPPSVSPSNLLVAAGDASDADLLKAAGDGLYVMSVTGLHSGVNPVSGSFSVGATGRLIRDGELAEPAREMTIASDLLAMLQGVTRAGAIARWVPFGGSVQAPALLVQEMTVAGA